MFYYISNACLEHTWHPLGTQHSPRLPEEIPAALTGQRRLLPWRAALPLPAPRLRTRRVTWDRPARTPAVCLRLVIAADFLILTGIVLFFSRLKGHQKTPLIKPYLEIIRRRHHRKKHPQIQTLQKPYTAEEGRLKSLPWQWWTLPSWWGHTLLELITVSVYLIVFLLTLPIPLLPLAPHLPAFCLWCFSK